MRGKSVGGLVIGGWFALWIAGCGGAAVESPPPPPPVKPAPPPEPEPEPDPEPEEEPLTPQLAWQRFGEARRGHCIGKPGEMEMPLEFEAGGHRYRIEGSRLVQLDTTDKVLRIGVISAIKDDRDLTLDGVRTLLGWMKKKGMDVLIANGDLATNSIEMDAIFPVLAESGVLVIAFTGNTESCGSFNHSADIVMKTHPNFVNGNWVRQIELAGATLLTLPGYFDRRFVHTGGAAQYKEKHIRTLLEMGREAPRPLVLTSHGPPKMTGRYGLDIASDVGHVGDPMMTGLVEDLDIKFGIYGHILEAGGLASDAKGKKRKRKKKWYRELFVNAGTANSDPWGMLDGRTRYGVGLLYEIKGRRARYQVRWLRRP